MHEPKTTPEENTLSRRELLKALAAAGGALGAAAFLPGKWTKPLVEAGVLPAHAQATFGPRPTIDLTDASASRGFFGQFDYNDPAGLWDANALLWAWVTDGTLKTQAFPPVGDCYLHKGEKIGNAGGYSGDGFS